MTGRVWAPKDWFENCSMITQTIRRGDASEDASEDASFEFLRQAILHGSRYSARPFSGSSPFFSFVLQHHFPVENFQHRRFFLSSFSACSTQSIKPDSQTPALCRESLIRPRNRNRQWMCMIKIDILASWCGRRMRFGEVSKHADANQSDCDTQSIVYWLLPIEQQRRRRKKSVWKGRTCPNILLW